MALTTSQIGNLLFKKFFSKGSTNDSRQFFEEPFEGRPSVYLDQLWLQVDKIPTTAPVLSNDQISGVVQYKQDLVLTAVPGTTNSFQSDQLKDAIPFYFGDGSYNYVVKSNTNASIPFGTNDWVIDADAGLLTFYNGVPANMPPKVSFYKYVGSKGSAILASPGIPIVQSIDSTVTNLPTGTSFTTSDNYLVTNGSWIVFTNLTTGSNKIYQASGVGTSLSWTEVFAFQGSSSPVNGNFLTITQGDTAGSLYRFETSWTNNLSDYVDSNELAAALVPYLTSSIAASTYETIDNVADGLALKLDLSGGNMSGPIDMGNNLISSLSNPVSGQDAATKFYVDEAIDTAVGDIDFSDYLKHDGSVAMTNDLDAGGFKITDLANPTQNNDAATKSYVDEAVSENVSDLRIYLTASGNISAGSPVFVVTTADETISSASASDIGTSRLAGIVESAIADGASGLVTLSGFATIPSGVIDGGSFVRGMPVFLSETTGNLTSTPPLTPGSRVYQVGLAVSSTKLIIDLKQGVTVS